MTAQTALKEKQEQLLLQQIHDVVESSPDSDLSKMILCDAHCDRGFFVQTYPKHLAIPNEILQTNINYLVSNDLIWIDDGRHSREEDRERFKKVQCSEGVKDYLISDFPFGSRKTFKIEGVEENKVREMMNSLKDFFMFSYNKKFRFDDLTKLEKLRRVSHDSLIPIRNFEEKYWYQEMGIPEQFSGFPSFVSKDDPTYSDGYRVHAFTFWAKFSSPDKAFEVGFDEAYGYPHSIHHRTNWDGKEEHFLPNAIDVRRKKEGYNVSLDNIWASVNWGDDPERKGSFAYRQEAKHMLLVLKEKLESVLNKD